MIVMLEKLRRHWPAIRDKVLPFLAKQAEKRKNRP